MKLHLPSALRKAVLACLAALALPATLPTTLATASGIAAAWLVAFQQVVAADVTITAKESYWSNAADSVKNAVGQKWDINVDDNVEGYQFYFKGSPGDQDNQNSVTNADLNFLRTLTVNQGYSGKGQTFNGAFTGGADADLVFRSWGNTVTNTWRFNGDLSGFAGDILLTLGQGVLAGTLNVEFGAGVRTNKGAIKQEGGTLNLTLNEGVILNNSEVSVNNLTVNGVVSFSANMQVTIAGAMNIGEGAALDLVSGEEALPVDDPFWFFEGIHFAGTQGLVSSVTSGGVEVTIDGQEVAGKKLAVSGGRMVLEDSTYQGGADTFTGPTPSGWGGDWLGDDVVKKGRVSHTAGGKLAAATDPEHYEYSTEEAPPAYALESGKKIFHLDVWSSEKAFVISGGSGTESVLINVCSDTAYYSGGAYTAILGAAGNSLEVENLWITFLPDEAYSDSTHIHGATIDQANYIGKKDDGTARVKNLYVNNAGLRLATAMDLGECNIFLGSIWGEGGWFTSDDNAHLRTYTLLIVGDITSTGDLTIVQNAQIVSDGQHTLTVDSLKGNGDIILSAIATGGLTLKITGQGGGEGFGGHICFEKTSTASSSVELADGATLTTRGIVSTTANGGTAAGGQFNVSGGSGEATVSVTGHNPVAAEGVVFGAGVTLELAKGSSQNFGEGSHITALKGGGALGVQGGTVTVDSLTGYTGEVHLFGDGTGKQAVLQVGGASGGGTGGTLSKVVLRQGGGTLKFGRGDWTLGALGVAAAPGGGGASQLDISTAVGASNGVTLQFGEGEGGSFELEEHVELTLGGGIDYSGTIVVDATGGATGERLFSVAGADLLEGLTLSVLLDSDALDGEWAGLKLFAENLSQEMKDALLKHIDGPKLPEGSDLELGITKDGYLRFLRSTAILDWQEEGGVWQNGGGTKWDVEGGAGSEQLPFQEGDSVVFDAPGGETPSAVKVAGTVKPNEMTVKSGEWSFAPAAGDANADAGIGATILRVEVGASAAVEGALGLSAERAIVDGELHLEGTGALSLGTAEVAGAVYLGSEGAVSKDTWSGTSIGGDGKVVLGVDATVDGDNNLFAALFAGGEASVERDAKQHAGIGTFEVAKGVTLTLDGAQEIGKSLSLIRDIQVDNGGTLEVRDGVFDNESSGYAQTGTITLGAAGEVATAAAEQAAKEALVFNVEGGTSVMWDIVLEGDAVVANQGGGEVKFEGGAELDAAGHRLGLVDGGFRFWDGFHAAEGSSGVLALADGAKLTVETANFAGYDVELGAGTQFTAQGGEGDVSFRDVRGSGGVVVAEGGTLVLGGRVWAQGKEGSSVELTLSGGSTLSVRGQGGKEASWVSKMTLTGGASALELTMGVSTDYAASGLLRVDSVVNDEGNVLTLTPGGIQDYIDAHRNEAGWDWTVQLFTGNAVGDLYKMWQEKHLQLGGVIGYDWTLDEKGKLTLTEKTGEYTWTDTKHGSAHQLAWKNGTVGNKYGKWDGDGDYENGVTAKLVGDTGEAVAVTVYGDVEAKAVTISGSSEFTFKGGDAGASLHVVDMSVGADSTFAAEVEVHRKMGVQAGKTATFTGGLVTANGSEVALEKGATVKLVGDNALKAKAGREMKVTGSGNWDVDLSGESGLTYDGNGATLGQGVKMHLTGVAADEDAEGDVWSNAANLNVQGELELTAGKQVVFTGTSRVGKLTAVYSNTADATNVEQVVLEGEGSTLKVTGSGNTSLGHVVLDIRGGTFAQTAGTLTVGGLRSNLHSEGVLEAQNLAITADDTWDIYDVEETGGQRGYSGSVHVAGNFTMNGKVWEAAGNGGDAGTEGDAVEPDGTGSAVGEDDYVQHLDGEVTVGGKATVQSGVLDVGSGGFTVGGQLGASGGQFKWHGGEMEVGSLNITGDGVVELATGEVTVNGGISGNGGTLDITGAPIEDADAAAAPEGTETVVVTLEGEAKASYTGEVKLGQGGTLAVESTGQVLGRVTAAGGALSVGDGKNLTVSTLNDAAGAQKEGARGLSSVTLGDKANWTLQGGTFTLAGPLAWGTGASITLDVAGGETAPSILLGLGFGIEDPAVSRKLTFNLSAEYLAALETEESGGKKRAHFLDNDREGSLSWQAGFEGYFDVLASDDPWNYTNLKLDADGYLTWDVKNGATWVEAQDGGEGAWADEPKADPSKGKWVDVQDPEKRVPSLSGKNVYLTKGGAGADGEAVLNVEGKVTPSNVYVESGVYTLKGEDGGGGIDLGTSGMLVVQEGAELNLNLKNTSLPMVIVEGTLGLGNAEALPTTGTELRLNKEGTLSYTVAGATQDVSEMVSAKSKSTALHVEVGDGVDVTWGAANPTPGKNNGLKLALDGGTVKSGGGNFTLKWTDAATHAGKQEVKAGSLTLEAAGGKSVLSGGAVVADGASLVLKATDALTYSGAVTGDGALEVAQGTVTLSGNNTVGNIKLTDGTTILGSDGALGNENTVLTLAGGDIQAGKGGKVGAGSVEVEKDASIVAGSVEITGKVTGKGTLSVRDKAKGTLSGDISGFKGALDTGTSTSSWTLSGIGGEVQATVMGKGALVANSKEEITLTGDLGTGDDDEVTLQNKGSGDLVIATDSVGSGTKLQTSKSGDIVLGNADTHVMLGGTDGWSFGAVTGEGSVVLANVTLPNAGVFGGLSGKTKLVVRTTQGGRVDVAGMNAGELDGITVNEHGLLTGAVGEYTVGKEKRLELHFTDGYWAVGTDTGKLGYLIGEEAPAGGAARTVAAAESGLSIHQGDKKEKDGVGLQLAFDANVLKGLYAAKQKDEIQFCVRALGGGTTWDEADGTAVFNALMNADDQIANVLAMAWKEGEGDGFTAEGLVLTVVLKDLYLVMKEGGDKHESETPVDLLGKKATVVLDGQKLTLNWAEDGTVSNLLGTEGAQLEINNTAKNPAADRLEVTFDNTFYSPITDDRAPGDFDTTKAKGQDTEFDGTITGGEGVDITKDGLGTLTVGGNYTLADGTTRLEKGRLVLSGEENAMKALEFAYQEKRVGKTEANGGNEEERGLVLDGGHTVLETISDEGSKEDGPGVVLQNGAELSLSGESTLSHTDFTGGEGSGTIALEGAETGGGSLALTGDASIKDVAVKLNGEKTVLDVGGGSNSLTALNGNGVLRGAAGGNLAISGVDGDGGTFTGTLDTTPGSEVGGTLTVQKGASFTLKNASSTATDTAHGWNVDVQQGGSLTLDLTGKTASSPLVFGNVTVAGDVTMQLDANLGGAPVRGNLTLTDTSTFTVYGTGKHGDTFSLGFSTSMDLGKLRDMITLDGAAFLADVVDDVKIGDDGTIWITTRLADENRFAVPGVHGNAQAGSAMLWGALRDPNSPLRDILENPTSGFALIVLDIYDKINNNKGGDTSGVDRALAGIAGSSISTLGSAVSQDLHRQLTSIRNRTTTMAAEVTQETYDRLPLWHAWITGETDYHKLDADSLAPGFTLNSWGGTLGVDADLTPHATAGLAVTAMYGDLKTEDAPDTADGSVDSVYVSAFLRATSGAWVHSLVISAGAADISLDRTVSYGGNSYRTSGSTNGYSLGALYEVGYTHIMNKRGTVAVQPVANVEIRHVGVDGYTETGSDGALRVDDIDQTVVTFGAGARMQAAVGTNAFNRTTVFESRLLVKVDAGDRSGAATTGLKGSNATAEVESAEVGAIGVEAGAGISVPLGRNYGNLFLDGSLEFRDGWTSANATLGYRINF